MNGWEVSDRSKPGPTALTLEDFPVDRFPYAIFVPHSPFAFGKLGLIVAGDPREPEEAKRIANMAAAAPDAIEALKARDEYLAAPEVERQYLYNQFVLLKERALRKASQ